MTEPIDRDELRDTAEGHLRYGGGGDDLANGILALLDALDAAEQCAEAAEGRIRAVRDVLDQAEAQEARNWPSSPTPRPMILVAEVRRALRGPCSRSSCWRLDGHDGHCEPSGRPAD